jgi:F0F1-type ATP synthase assembly protein I
LRTPILPAIICADISGAPGRLVVKRVSGSGHIWQMACVVVLSTLVPLCLGIWLDHRFGMAPLFILIGALVGILAGTVGVVYIASRTMDALGRTPESTANADEEAIGKED